MALIAAESTGWGGVSLSTGAIDTTGAKLIVATVISYPTLANFTDSEGNTWVPLTSIVNTLYLKQYYCINPTTNAAHTFTASGAGASFAQLGVQAFSDVVTFFDDIQNSGAGGGTSLAPGSIDPSPDNALFVTGIWLEGSDAPTIGSSFTQDETNTTTHTISLASKSSITAENPTWAGFTAGATYGSLTSMAAFLAVPADPPVITTTTLPNGSTGAAYSQTLANTGGTDPIAWSVISGALPDGLTLNASTGEISGTPTAIDTFSFTVQATDDVALTDTQALTIEISSPFGTFDVLDLTGMRLENVGWVGAVLRASFGRGFGAQANPSGSEGLHKWFLHSGGVWPDFTDWGLTINGVARFEYYWEFFKDHTTGSTDIFIIEWRDEFYHASFAETEISMDKLKNMLLYEGGIAVNQRRIVGGAYNENGSIAGSPALRPPEDPEAVALSDTSVELSWTASPDGADGYEYRIDGGSPFDAGDVITITVDTLIPGTEYVFEVRAYKDASFSAWVAADPVTTETITPFAGGDGLLFRDDFTDLAAWTGTGDFAAVANPSYVAFEPSRLTYEPAGTFAGGAREPSILFVDGVYYLFHDGPAADGEPWNMQMSTSTDGITWTHHGVPWFGLQKTDDILDGEWAGRGGLYAEVRAGVWYWHTLTAPGVFGDNIPAEPYGSDVWTSSDPLADDWAFVRTTMGDDVHAFDDNGSYVSSIVLDGGTYYAFCGCKTVTGGAQWRCLYATASSPDGPFTKVLSTLPDDDIKVNPENPKIWYSDTLNKWVLLVNQVNIATSRTDLNSIFLSDDLTDWSDATRHDFQQTQPIGSELDSVRAIGLASPVMGEEAELLVTALGNLTIAFDADPPATPDGNHLGRRIKFAGMEASASRAEVDSFGTAGTLTEMAHALVHDDFVAELVVEISDNEADGHASFRFRDDYVLLLYASERLRLYKDTELLVDWNGTNTGHVAADPEYFHHRWKVIVYGNRTIAWLNGEKQIDYADNDSPVLSGTEIKLGGDRIKASFRRLVISDGTFNTITGLTPGDVVLAYGPGPHTPQGKVTVGVSGEAQFTASAYPIERLVVNDVSYDVEIYGGEENTAAFYGI